MAIKRIGLRVEDRARPRGVHFPFMKRKDGLPSADVPPEIFSSNVKQILMTTPGERVMRPTFGSYLRMSVFANVSDTLLANLEAEVRRAITTWEPRVAVTGVRAESKDSQITIFVDLFSPFGPAQTELSFKVN
jgi:phage baseplate assembly protein W